MGGEGRRVVYWMEWMLVGVEFGRGDVRGRWGAYVCGDVLGAGAVEGTFGCGAEG